jgi:hypothetical protein
MLQVGTTGIEEEEEYNLNNETLNRQETET